MTTLKVGIADDHAVFRTGLSHVVAQLADKVQIVEASGFEQALEHFGKEKGLDLVLVDLFMPGMNALKGVQALCEQLSDIPVVVVSMSDRAADVRNALNVGAKGYIPKTSSADIMLNALKLIMSGGVYLPPNVLHTPSLQNSSMPRGRGAGGDSGPLAGLTPRQREVLELVGQGKSNKEIASELGLADGTVKIHMTKIFKTLHVKNRMQAVLAVSRLTEEQGGAV